jgi:hypothetical protein
VAIAALGIVVLVGVWVVAKGSREVVTTPVPAAVLPSSHAPRGSVPVAEGASPGGGGSRGRAIAVVIGALGIVVLVGVWVVAIGPREVVVTPVPAVSGTATAAPAVPSVQSSASVVMPAPSAAPIRTSEVDAGASVAPHAPTTAALYKPKGAIVKGEDPYDAAAPLPAKTVEPVVPSPLPPTTVGPVVPVTPTAPPPSDSTVPRGLPYRKKDQ